MADELLILHPAQDIDASGGDIAALLVGCGALGERFDYSGETHYRPGKQFGAFFEQTAAHKVVQLDAPGGPAASSSGEHVHVSIEDAGSVEFIGSALTEDPRCPACGASMDAWGDLVGAWYDAGAADVVCGGCGAENDLMNLDWRERAGFARVTVRIWGVRPGEVAVLPAAWALLEKETGAGWRRVWYRI